VSRDGSTSWLENELTTVRRRRARVAATFSLRLQRRGGASMMIVSGVVTGFLLYFLSDIVFALGVSARLPVLLAAWTPTGVSMIFGASMLLHLEDG